MHAPNSTKAQEIYRRYLDNYAEAESQLISPHSESFLFEHLVVVPAYNEEVDFLKRLQQHCENQSNVLAIIIINQPDKADTDDTETLKLNQILFDFGYRSGVLRWQNENLSCVSWKNNCHLILIDRFTEDRKIPFKQGVGLARKIACDVGIALLAKNNSSQSKNTQFIHSTDADATLPPDYFQHQFNAQTHSAATYPFVHRDESNAVSSATHLYEQSLHYYVDSLHWAGSPYAFHTIGSCLAFSATHYCQVRGFPKRSGGEDFYLLNKLAKLAPIRLLAGEKIILESRISKRVPFGTGPAVDTILKLNAETNFKSYDPRVFQDLSALIVGLESLWCSRDDTKIWLKKLSKPSQQALEVLNIEQLFSHINKNVNSETQCKQQIRFWFDAFKTLRFIHELQKSTYPAMSFIQALKQMEIIISTTITADKNPIPLSM